MLKRGRVPARLWAQKLFLLLVLCGFCVPFLDSDPAPVSAQEASPTPGVVVPVGTETVIPEIPTTAPISIFYPIHLQTLRGTVNITGLIATDGWTSYEVAFSYAENATSVWFPFATGKNPLVDNALAVWDTTTLTDGDYNLRLRVFNPDGSSQDAFVYGLRVRNYTIDTPIPSITPTSTATSAATALPTATVTITPTPFPTPTALPSNRATLSTGEITANLGLGAVLAAVLFGIFGMFLWLRSPRK